MYPCAVSILVPAFNVEKYLRQCLDSLVNQTLGDIQIICIDDGSTDLTLSILEEYARNDDRIEIISKKNTGYGNSMNLGLSYARGEYIGIVEPDDFADVSMFEKLYEAAKKNNADVVKSNYYEHKSDNAPDQDAFVENLNRCTYNKIFSPRKHHQVLYMRPAIWSAIYRRKYLEENAIRFLETPGASFQDTGFNFKALTSTERVYLVKEGFLHYRIDNAASSVKAMSKVFCICDEYEEMWRYTREHADIFRDLKTVIPFIQFGGYSWNLDRLSSELQYGFYKRFVKDFRSLDEEGLIDSSVFGVRSRERVEKIISDPDGYFRSHYGPVGVGTTYLVWASSKQLAKAAFSEVAKCAGASDEIIGACQAADACVDKIREDDTRFFTSDDLFKNPRDGELLPQRIRGSKLVSVFCFGEPAFLSSAIERCVAKGRTEDNCQLESTDSFTVVAYNTSSLFSSEGPVLFPLLSTAYYSESLSATAHAKPVPWTFDYTDYEHSQEGYVSAVEAVVSAHERGMHRCKNAEEKLAFQNQFAPLWRSIRKLYDALPCDIQRNVHKASAKDLAAVALTPAKHDPVDVSVVIPVFNVERYLPECLDSVLCQVGVSLQVICIDDGSTDGSLDKLRGYSKKDPRVQIVSQLNGGAGAARNRGISYATGEYLAFIDPDDFYPSDNTLQIMLQAARKNDALMAGGSFSTVDPTGHINEDLHEEDAFYRINRAGWRDSENIPTDYGWIRFIYDKRLFEKGLRFPELAWYEDPVFFINAITLAKRVFVIPDVTYRYRVDYKQTTWGVEKTRDLLRGISSNLDAAAKIKNRSLYSLMIRRIDWDYCDRIARSLDDDMSLLLLSEIQCKFDEKMADPSAPLNSYHVLYPLAIMQGNSQIGRGTAVVRLARKIENTELYHKAQALIRRIRNHRS